MSEPFMSEIKIMSFGFAPKGWAQCNGQLLPINQNQALFSLLGTTYGGDGRVNFGLPNLQGRAPTHMGQGLTLGEVGGEQNHTLVMSEMPAHTHVANASSLDGDQPIANGHLLAGTATVQLYDPTVTNLTSLLPSSLSNVGGSQPHSNMQPYLTLNFCIALQGIFPSRN
jgi:microcystin-dependent protein